MSEDELIKILGKISSKAVEEIKGLLAENKRLRLALKGYSKHPDECNDDMPCVSHMAYEQCEAENKRYIEALEKIQNSPDDYESLVELPMMARQALENDNVYE